ncbi:MAG: hypothetical protein JNL32_05800 [Candidatus Kapabacteria bacterium]|nr:hypothetical protein [Candidatus Kapabacteria bacterium]
MNILNLLRAQPLYTTYTPEQAQKIMRRQAITGYVSLFAGLAILTALVLEVLM